MGIGYDPLVVGNRKVMPSIGNIFMNRQTVYVFFQVYGAAADPQSDKPSIETYLMLLKDNTKIMESKPELVQDWTKETALPGGGPGGRGAPGLGGPGGMRGMGRGDMGGPRAGGPADRSPSRSPSTASRASSGASTTRRCSTW